MRGGYSGRGFGGGQQNSGSNGRYRNPCLTMHQPWASLLVHGIKRVEGRSWPSPITGRLWIHAASKVPDPDTIRAMEDFYREIYAVNGVTDIEFPQHYPVSRLLGCVEVVGCVRSEELVCWEDVPESVRLEGLTDFCWLCENPQKLVVPFEMRGYQGVYNLERRIHEGAVRGLSPVQGPLPVKFPLPDPRNPFSLKPGALNLDSSKSTVINTPSVSAAIARARAAATQYSRKDNNTGTSSQIETQDMSRGNRAHGSSGSGSLPPIVQNNPSYLQNQPIVQNGLSYSQNQNPSAVVQNSSSYLQKQNPSALVQNSPYYFQNQNPSAVIQNSPSYSQNQNPSAVIQNSPYFLQNQNPSVNIQNTPSYLQNQNPPAIVQNSLSCLQDQNTSFIVSNSPSFLQNHNAEPRRSPRLQSGASNRLLAVALRELKQTSVSERRQQSVPRSRPEQ